MSLRANLSFEVKAIQLPGFIFNILLLFLLAGFIVIGIFVFVLSLFDQDLFGFFAKSLDSFESFLY
jgi:hypothetical protein